MHHGYEKELQDVMAKAFKGRFGRDIGIKLESKMPYPSGDGKFISSDFDDIISGLEGDCHQRLELFRGKTNE